MLMLVLLRVRVRMRVLLTVLVLALSFTANANCYLNATGRGVGVPISTCPQGMQEDAGLCYVPCKDGYSGVGPVCWQNCPPGYVDTGAFCQPESVWGDNSACPPADKCGLIYKSSQGCVKCPAGMDADGCICSTPGSLFAKDSYGRGVGTPLVCAPNLEYDAGLCYPPCAPDANGVGPVCWSQCQQGNFTCGAICTADSQECTGIVEQLADDLFKLTIQLWLCIAAAIEGTCSRAAIQEDINNIIQTLNIPLCSWE